MSRPCWSCAGQGQVVDRQMVESLRMLERYLPGRLRSRRERPPMMACRTCKGRKVV